MTWPALDQCVKMTDISRYANWRNQYADRAPGRVDFVELKKQNPDLMVVLSRVAGAWPVWDGSQYTGIDPDFEHNYDGSGAAGFDVGCYINNNPAYTVDYMLNEWWGPAIGDRKPRLIMLDAETNGWRDEDGNWHGVFIPAVVTQQLYDMQDVIAREWPDAFQWIYSGHWWPENVAGWNRPDTKFMIPHYPYWKQDRDGNWIQVETFEEMDCKLPVSYATVPKLNGRALTHVIAWQFSEKGILEPISGRLNYTPRVDLDYLLLSEYNRVWGDGEEPVEPVDPIEPVDPGEDEQDMKKFEFTVVVTALRIRSKPTIGAEIIGVRGKGDVMLADDVYVESAGRVWAHDAQGWSAIVHDGSALMV